MSNKKSLLTESEVRRFMSLANIPVVGRLNESESEEYASGKPGVTGKTPMKSEGSGVYEQKPGMYEEEPMPTMEEEEELELGDEMGAGGMEGGDDKEARFEEAILTLAELAGIEVDTGGGAEGGDEMEIDAGGEEEEEEAGEEEEEEEAGEKEAEEMEEGEHQEQEDTGAVMQEAKLVDTVLARVTARLVAEAKKKKEEKGKKKKMSAAEKMKAMKAAKDKKKKLEEANAPAPKATMSNGSGAGVAKGHGPGKKAFGTSRTEGHEWKSGKNTKGDEMSAESASAEHTVSHGKKNLATQGGNKKK